jgi:hypothetical protein
MKLILKIISYLGLALTIIPSVLVFKGVIDLKTDFILMVVGIVLWFSTAPLWMKSQSLEDSE